MPIYKGNNRLSDIYSGNTSIGKVYAGNTLVFQKSGEDPPPPPPPEVRMDTAYGYLYNWYVIREQYMPTPRYIAASGWVIPTATDYVNLFNYVNNNYPGGVSNKIRSSRMFPADHPRWMYGNENTIPTDDSKFGATPAGTRSRTTGSFGFISEQNYLWAGNMVGNINYSDATVIRLSYLSSNIDIFHINRGQGCTIRAMETLSLEEASAIPDFTILENWYTGNDGKQYNCVKIFDKVYTENLRETEYRDGSSIVYGTTNLEWTDGSSARISLRCAYNNDESLATGNINQEK